MDNNENKKDQILAATNELKLDFNNRLNNTNENLQQQEEKLFAINRPRAHN